MESLTRKKSQHRFVFTAAVALAMCVVNAAPFDRSVNVPLVGDVEVSCKKPGGWRLETEVSSPSEGVSELTVRLSSDKPLPPSSFTMSFSVDQIGAFQRWTGMNGKVGIPPDWSCKVYSRLCGGMPLVAFLDDADANRLTVTVSEAKRFLKMWAGLREEDARFVWTAEFFSEPEAPLARYEAKVRFDSRSVFFGDAISDGIAWVGLKQARVPDAAFEPLYSSWYVFHQNLSDRDVEEECALAAKMGMKVVIVDDGWQTEDSSRRYAYSGDWEVAKSRFPDMASHVARVHAMGMKYLMWYAPPFIGLKSKNYERFKGKYLYTDHGQKAAVLDPRFPEVRAFLCGVLRDAVAKWDIDGFKLDFVYAFSIKGEDPAVKENYAGRDLKSLPEAVDRLLKEIHADVTAAKGDALIEFRQPYAGPGMLQYGNMFRAHDCPGDLLQNRCSIANLRLAVGGAAVHADPLMWNVKDTPENAARFVLSSIFSTAQYSVMLRTLPKDHRRMLEHWIGFSLKHRKTLLHSAFRPHGFGLNYPVIEAESAEERIVAVYGGESIARCGKADRDVYVLNGAQGDSVVIDFDGTGTAEIFDTFGEKKGTLPLSGGVQRIAIPQGGYALIRGR